MTVDRIRGQRTRTWAGAAVAVVAVVIASAAASWACSPAASMSGISPEAGGAGSEVTVTGQYMTPVVEIRWGSQTGPLLASVAGPSFSTRVRIPQASPGLYYIMAIGRDSDGSIAGKASSAFEVRGTTSTEPAPTSPAPDPAPTAPAQTSTGSSTAPSSSATSPTATAAAPTGESQSSAPAASSTASSSPAAAATSAATASPAAPAGSAGSSGSSSATAAAAARARPATGAQNASATTPTGLAAPQASTVTDVPAAAPAAAPAAGEAAVPTPEPVTSQIEPLKPAWQTTPTDQHVGLLNVDGVHSHTTPIAGLALALALGTAALFGGFAFVTVIRRRQLAESTTR